MSALKKTFVPVGVVGPPCSSALPLRSPDTTRRMGLSAPSGMLPDLRARQMQPVGAGATDLASTSFASANTPWTSGNSLRQPGMAKQQFVSRYMQHLPGPRLGRMPSTARCPPASAAQAHTISVGLAERRSIGCLESRGAAHDACMDD